MLQSNTTHKSFSSYLIVFFLTICSCAYADLPGNRIGGSQRPLHSLNTEEAAAFLTNIQNRIDQYDYSFSFTIENYNNHTSSHQIQGLLFCYGSSLEIVTQNQKKIFIELGKKIPKVLSSEDNFTKNIDVFKPIIPNCIYNALDISFSFIYWDQYIYEGPTKSQGRSAHIFFFPTPKNLQQYYPELKGIRATIDTQFYYTLKTEWIDNHNKILRAFKVLNFKKNHNGWFIKSIDLIDYSSKEKSRITFTD